MDFSAWQEVNRTKTFFDGMGKDISKNKALLLTPVVLDSGAINALKDAYGKSAKIVGHYYSAPIFRFGTTLQYKHQTYMIISAHMLQTYDTWLKINYSIALGHIDISLNKVKEKLIEDSVRFRKGNCKEARGWLVSTEFDGDYYGYKVINEVLPFNEVVK